MPRPPVDEVKICDSQKTGFRAGRFSLASPPPLPRFVTLPRPNFRARPRWRRRSQTPRFPGFSAIRTPTNRLQAGYGLRYSVIVLSVDKEKRNFIDDGTLHSLTSNSTTKGNCYQ